MAYVYTHTRLDKNEVFYVGIANSNTDYHRAYEKCRHTNFWKRVVNKTSYRVDIIKNNLTWEEACKKEIELIKFYGRKDLGLGSLVNLTDGGDGIPGRRPILMTAEIRNKISKAKLGVKQSQESIERRVRTVKEKAIDIGGRLVLNLETGIFYGSIRKAAIAHSLSVDTLYRWLNGESPNKSMLILV